MTPTPETVEAAKKLCEFGRDENSWAETESNIAQFLTDYTAAKDTLIAELRNKIRQYELVMDPGDNFGTDLIDRAEQLEKENAELRKKILG